MARTHVVMPDELLGAIDRVVGKRGRSRFIGEAAAEKLERLALADAITETAGIARGAAYDYWLDRDAAAEWVRSGRQTETVG